MAIYREREGGKINEEDKKLRGRKTERVDNMKEIGQEEEEERGRKTRDRVLGRECQPTRWEEHSAFVSLGIMQVINREEPVLSLVILPPLRLTDGRQLKENACISEWERAERGSLYPRCRLASSHCNKIRPVFNVTSIIQRIIDYWNLEGLCTH